MRLHLLRKIWRFPRTALKRFVSDLLRLMLLSQRPWRMAQRGFVLPTTVLLVLVVVLTATALTYRTLSRSQMGIAQREQVRVAAVAAPAVDRAKAKIEFLFTSDPRLTSGLPTPDVLASMMLATPYDPSVTPLMSGKDPFTLPGEDRIDLNNDGKLDNAWKFTDSDTGEQIVYSVLVDNEATVSGSTIGVRNQVNQAKANALVTRTGPLAATSPSPVCVNARAESGWEVVDSGNSAALQKNFQINVFVPGGNEVNRTLEAFEFQQSRIADRGNKWAAWFRYDLEIYPGASFQLNGAMHTDSNLIVGGFQPDSKFEAYKISSHNSCVYSKEASEITVGVGTSTNVFEGQVVQGSVVKNAYSGTGDNAFHIWDGDRKIPTTSLNMTNLTSTNDSVSGGKPSDVATNPLELFTTDRLENNNSSTWSRDKNAWDNNPIHKGERIDNRRVPKPFVDDLFRADNRWGPKPRYSETIPKLDLTNSLNSANKSGDSISTTDADLNTLRDATQGLDGFWERQAIANGLRIIVGERLELGNPSQWNYEPNKLGSTAANNPEGNPVKSINHVDTSSPITPSDRLYPPSAASTVSGIGENEYRQKRSLRDNLAAVQGMVVYHYQKYGGQFPAACVAFTSHPGTLQSIVDSRTFDRWTVKGKVASSDTTTTDNSILPKTDFLHGKGTNGWEFKYNGDFDTLEKFRTQVLNDAPLGKALRNLAYFAGDPKGGSPSFPAVQDERVHPFPYHAMWGDFSALRRLVEGGHLNTAEAFDALSPADKATVHSAACTLSLLAYNLERETTDYKNLYGSVFPSSLTTITERFGNLIGAIAAYMSTGNMSPQFKDGNKKLEDLLRERKIDRPSWFEKQYKSGPADTEFNPNFTLTTVAGFEGYFNAANGKNPGGAAQYFNSLSFEDWLAIARYVTGGMSDADLLLLKNFSDQVNQFNSVVRDRDLGFRPGLTKKDLNFSEQTRRIGWDEETGYTVPVRIKTDQKDTDISLQINCDPNMFREISPGGVGGDNNVAVGGLIGCSARNKMPVSTPSLFYLFPLNDHSLLGKDDYSQPLKEEFIHNINIYNNAYSDDSDLSASSRFQIVWKTNDTAATDPTDPDYIDAALQGIKHIAAVPRKADGTGWVLPVGTKSTNRLTTDPASVINNNPFLINLPPTTDTAGVVVGTEGLTVPILDKGMFDGREQLAVRVADLDLKTLTSTTVSGGTDKWIPDTACDSDPATTDPDCNVFSEGIVYAFREDAVREDEIVRPKKSGQSVAGCLTAANITSADCRIKTTPGSEQDPPLTDKGISLKPVDFVADPDRRPHGFRLRNGRDMSNGKARDVGMTFVTDNSVYIMGDFNLHSTDGTSDNLIEEFTEKLGADAWTVSKFYTDRKTLDSRFATPGSDTWRPVEILADAFTILSGGFKDGAVEDTFIQARPGGTATSNTSYMNQSRPTDSQRVVREDGTFYKASSFSKTTSGSPVWIGRNGNALVSSDTSSDTGICTTDKPCASLGSAATWTTLSSSNTDRYSNVPQVDSGSTVRVNATFIGGLVPSRPNQGYGGLQNFPRLIEHWQGRNLVISGSFLQLNFSTASTAPFEQDAWEPGTDPSSSDENLGYFFAPTRRWGYDPGLLYYPPAAAARRFVSVGSARSEYFRDLPIDDPYINLLRCAEDKNGTPIFTDPIVRGTACPN